MSDRNPGNYYPPNLFQAPVPRLNERRRQFEELYREFVRYQEIRHLRIYRRPVHQPNRVNPQAIINNHWLPRNPATFDEAWVSERNNHLPLEWRPNDNAMPINVAPNILARDHNNYVQREHHYRHPVDNFQMYANYNRNQLVRYNSLVQVPYPYNFPHPGYVVADNLAVPVLHVPELNFRRQTHFINRVHPHPPRELALPAPQVPNPVVINDDDYIVVDDDDDNIPEVHQSASETSVAQPDSQHQSEDNNVIDLSLDSTSSDQEPQNLVVNRYEEPARGEVANEMLNHLPVKLNREERTPSAQDFQLAYHSRPNMPLVEQEPSRAEIFPNVTRYRNNLEGTQQNIQQFSQEMSRINNTRNIFPSEQNRAQHFSEVVNINASRSQYVRKFEVTPETVHPEMLPGPSREVPTWNLDNRIKYVKDENAQVPHFSWTVPQLESQETTNPERYLNKTSRRPEVQGRKGTTYSETSLKTSGMKRGVIINNERDRMQPFPGQLANNNIARIQTQQIPVTPKPETLVSVRSANPTDKERGGIQELPSISFIRPNQPMSRVNDVRQQVNATCENMPSTSTTQSRMNGEHSNIPATQNSRRVLLTESIALTEPQKRKLMDIISRAAYECYNERHRNEHGSTSGENQPGCSKYPDGPAPKKPKKE